MLAERPRILLLEDKAVHRAGIRLLIQQASPAATIAVASSYDECKALLEAASFDLAFLDYDLGSDKTGLDVLRLIRERGWRCLAVMLSDHDDGETVNTCLAAGACGFIPKDVDTRLLGRQGAEEVLEEAISTVMNGVLYLPPSVTGRGSYNTAVGVVVEQAGSVSLSPRQMETLYYLCQGLPNKQIANLMGIGESTVRQDYVTAIFREFGVTRRSQLILEVWRRRIQLRKPPGREPRDPAV
jgi:two-component system, NarL family, nitrate/nitrite response regulator NarL